MHELLFVFGLPGAGKTYVAEILHDEFGYAMHNGDEDLPEYMREALMRKSEITDAMRQEFVQSMIRSIKKHILKQPKLVVHQTLLKNFMRKELQTVFPNATFLFVESDTSIREKRYLNRIYFNLGLTYLRHMSALFDVPSGDFASLKNSHTGRDLLVDQLSNILQGSNHT